MDKEKHTLTEKNVETAFAGESMANRKYLYFAKQARKLGNSEIAELFENIAHQETAHAFSHLELIYPTQDLTVQKLLELAIEGELYETNYMYPEFERTAIAEGKLEEASEFIEQAKESKEHASIFANAAKRFSGLAKVEKLHAAKYQKALQGLKQSASG